PSLWKPLPALPIC
nr:immunoglobulin heavy chain junction region [Mus musculus]